MKREYDFSKAIRGKFYKKGAKLHLPIYLNIKLQKQLEHLANKKGENIGDVVNKMIKKEIEYIEQFI